MQKPYLVLGLDPGIASCGFALLDMNNQRILEMGSHLFDAPQEDKTKVSLAVARRAARSARRNNERTKNRQKHCLELLKNAGLVPNDAGKQWMQSKKGDRPLLELRAQGLDRLLTDREFAQVLYCLSARRGYIPHGEGRINKTVVDTKDANDAETGKVLKAIAENNKRLANGGYRTVGEMLYAAGKSRNVGGAYENCVLNAQIQDEVHALFAAQRSFSNAKATEVFENDFIRNLVWEKKSLDHDAKVYALVGRCSYFPAEKRAALADLSSELCRAYERFGHIRIVDPNGEEQSLSSAQIDHYIGILFSPTALKNNKSCKVTYALIRKDLDLSAHCVFKGVETAKEKDREPFAPKAWRNMRSHGLPEELLQRMLEDRHLADAIGESLTYASSEESLEERLAAIDLSDIERDAILALPFSGKTYKGYGSRSLMALELLLDSFEDPNILTLTDAERASGLLGKRLADEGARFTLLPSYDYYDKECNNPVVLRAMGRMRRIVNAIIKIHGVPDEIHIELGRDLKRSKREKDMILKRNRENETKNKQRRKDAAEVLGIDPNEIPAKILRKMALHEQQGGFDAYTGEPIVLERMIKEDRYCEIDHVLPYSRTCDDSQNNKLLVLAKSNQDKGGRTPYEWMTEDAGKGAPSWDEYKARVLANRNVSFRKRTYLLNTDLGPEKQMEFLSRNLNDDRYMSRAVKDYLESMLQFPDDGRKKHVISVAGGATAALRHVWGLNLGAMDTKDREDDRHHAVDACVIAACSESTLPKVAKARSLGRETFKRMREDRLSSTQPWPTFAAEVLARREFVIPTRMVSHGVTGRAFEDTNYCFFGFTEDKKKLALLKGNGKLVKKGNIVIGKDNNAHLVDGMAFLRLWLDSTAKNGKGKWYAEPVYYADIPAIRNGTYVPKAGEIGVSRATWKPLPQSAMLSKPVTLFRGDVLMIDDCAARFWTININTVRLIMRPLMPNQSVSGFPSLGKWNAQTKVTVIREDCLGHCYNELDLKSASED